MGFTFSRSGRHSPAEQPPGTTGKLGATLFFGFFLAMGLMASWFLGAMIFQSLATYTWKEAPAKILHSVVSEDSNRDSPFSVAVRFQYEWKGQTHTSTKYMWQTERSNQYDTVQKKVNALPVGKTVTCLVNPSRPTEAILRRNSPWFALFIFIPLVFVALGGGGIFFTWFSREARTNSVSPASKEKKSENNKAPLLLGIIFTLVGACVLVFWFLPAFTKAQASRNWPETPCTVISSRVKTHSGDSTTYSVDIFYRYDVNGREYKSNRYKNFSGSSSGREGKAEVVRRYPAGSKQICYVNPENPTEAVLKPGLGWEALFGLLPVIFLLVGIFLLIGRYRSRTSAPSIADPTTGGEANPVALKSSASPLAKFVGICFAALIWNGITSVFLWQLLKSFQRGSPDWFLTIFLTPFVLVGLALLGGIGYFLLALTNPRCRLQLHPSTLRPGQPFTVTWEFRGAVHRMSQLRIALEGREEASYKRGTNTSTDKEVFASHPLVEVGSRMEMRQGSIEFLLPAGTMPSFTASHNKLIWALKVQGTISRWPDVKEEYPVSIVPAPSATTGHEPKTRDEATDGHLQRMRSNGQAFK